MADPLSVAASIAGLLSITIELGKILGPYVSAVKDTSQIALRVYSEVQSTQVILSGLQKLTNNLASTNIQHAALISVDQLVAILTDGVLIFSELEDLFKSLIPQRRADQRLPLLLRLQWVREESTLNSLLTRLEACKSSMNLMLVILMSDSHSTAMQHQAQLIARIDALLETNHALSQRLMSVEDGFDSQTILSKRMSLLSIADLNPFELQPGLSDISETAVYENRPREVSAIDFEDSLEASRVYRRAQRDTMDYSFRSSVTKSRAWSILSGLSLDDVSAISVIALPVYQNELTNARHYDFGSDADSLTTQPVASQPTIAQSTIPQPMVAQSTISQPMIAQPVAPRRSQKTERPMLVECFEIVLKMNQLPECKEYFRGLSLSPDSAFDELWMVLRQGMPLLKLLQALDPKFNLQPIYQTGFSPPVAMIQRFLGYCRTTLNMEVGHIFTAGILLRDDALGFFKIMPLVSFVMNRLTDIGVVNAVDVKLNSMPLGGYTYEPTKMHAFLSLQKFLSEQRRFIQQLAEFADMRTTFETTRISSNDVNSIFGNIRDLANFHIHLLSIMERNLFRLPEQQLWGPSFEYHAQNISAEAIFICNEQLARITTIKSFSEGKLTVEGSARDLALKCLHILALPAQRLGCYTDLLKELVVHCTIEKLSSCLEDLSHATAFLKLANSQIMENNDSAKAGKALIQLKLQVDDWKGFNPNDFGKLLLFETIETIPLKATKTKTYQAYLFQAILLICKPLVSRTKNEVKGDIKLRISGRIFLQAIQEVYPLPPKTGAWPCEITWHTSESPPKLSKLSFEFKKHARMETWVSTIRKTKLEDHSSIGYGFVLPEDAEREPEVVTT